MPSNPLVDEYADLLGLVTGTPDTLLSKEASEQDRLAARVIEQKYHTMFVQEAVAFWHELSSRYLPSYLFYHYGRPLHPVTDEPSHERWVRDTNAVHCLLVNTSSRRFTLQHPETVLKYYLEMAKRLEEFPRFLFVHTHACNLILPFCIQDIGIFHRALLNTYRDLHRRHLPATYASLERLHELLPIIRRLRAAMPENKLVPFDEGMETFKEICQGKWHTPESWAQIDKQRAERDHQKLTAEMWCAAKKTDQSLVCTPSYRVGGEVQMMKCGRCQEVQYCSQERQRVSWKTQGHKALCFQTTW